MTSTSIKRILALLLTTFFVFSFIGCNKNDNEDRTEGSAKAASQTAAKTESKATPSKNVSEEDKTVSYPLTVTDSYGRTVTIKKEPQRIISAGPNITEIIYALGLGEKLVGRTDYCDYPEEVKNVQSIGPIDPPNIEKIVELKPDLVLVSAHFKLEVAQQLEELGIAVVGFYSDESFEGGYDTIRNVGHVLNRENEAESIISSMKQKVEEITAKVKGLDRPLVYYVSDYYNGAYTAGGDTFIGQLIEMAGGENAAGDVKGWVYSLEKLVEKNPDIMVCSKFWGYKEGIEQTEVYKDLDAVKNGRLFEIDDNMIIRQGPRLADGLEALARIIHPEAFEN